METNMLRESYQLYRFAQAQVAEMTKARLPQKFDLKNFYDLETPSGKRIDVKACRVHIDGTRRMARYSINRDKDGRLIKERIDYLVCLAYDESMRVINVLCVPAADLPDWETSIGVSMSPSKVSRSNKWYKFITTLEELKTKLK
jgi:hypothetical protein